MAKKKKENIVIIDKELTPTIIGKLDTKEKSPLLLIFIFIIFIVVALFLPDITNYIEESLNGNNSVSKTEPNDSDKKDEEQPSSFEENPYYDYTTDLVITNDIFTISNIVVSENKIYFDLKNNTNNQLNLEDNNKYFLEIYTNDTTLLQRIKISYGLVEANATLNYSYDLESKVSTSLSKLLLVSKTTEDYPEFIINNDESGIGNLACTKNYETITYTFGNSQLTNINRVINYPFASNDEYKTNLQKYQTEAAVNNNYEGISSTLITSENGFVYTTLIDLQKADISYIENKNYYSYRTLAKVVKFETESNGFSCN